MGRVPQAVLPESARTAAAGGSGGSGGSGTADESGGPTRPLVAGTGATAAPRGEGAE